MGQSQFLANYKPEMFGNMVRSYLNKEYEKALKYQNELREYFEWMDLEGNPTSIKTALKTIHPLQENGTFSFNGGIN